MDVITGAYLGLLFVVLGAVGMTGFALYLANRGNGDGEGDHVSNGNGNNR